jgi:hypothetical protein
LPQAPNSGCLILVGGDPLWAWFAAFGTHSLSVGTGVVGLRARFFALKIVSAGK